MTNENTAVRAVISGRVQGVWYRGWTCEQARALGLDGWVRNRRDGTVEALFSGPAEDVREMLRRCEAGPPAARVVDVKSEAAAPPGEEGFNALPTI